MDVNQLNQSHSLSFQTPAEAWTDAFPLGNGRLGTMSFGGVSKDLVSLNEDTFWSGYPRAWQSNPHYVDKDLSFDPTAWNRARDLCAEGRYVEAEQVLEDNNLGPYTEAYLPLGDLHVAYDYGSGYGNRIVESHTSNESAESDSISAESISYQNYQRTLDYRTGIHRVAYTIGNTHYTREEFVSLADDAYFQRIQSTGDAVNVEISFSSPIQAASKIPNTEQEALDSIEEAFAGQRSGAALLDYLQAPAVCMPSYLGEIEDAIIYATDPAQGGMGACSAVLVFDLSGQGHVLRNETSIRAQSQDLLLVWSAQTTFNGVDKHPWQEGKPAAKLLAEALSTLLAKPGIVDYTKILDRHAADFSSYYDRVQWDVEAGDSAEFSAIRRLFNFGRYLMIAGSQPGTEAMNLQGIWNKEVRAPWSANYTLNINLEMNYWPVETVNLAEFHQPLLAKVKSLSQQSRAVAKEVYGVDGAVVHHNTDLWNHSLPVGILQKGSVVYSVWPMGLLWLAQHLVRHYEYNLDDEFLRADVYPVLLECVRFVLPLLTRDQDNKLVFGPATSPEHWFTYGEDQRASVGESSAMTQSLIRELLLNFLSCSTQLRQDELVPAAKDALGGLLPLELGEQGQIKEWSGNWQDGDVHHRHISHLYGLFPGSEINIYSTPQLAEACKKTLEIRGDEGTGWSLGWKVLCWARLHEAERAYQVLLRQLKHVEADTKMNMHDGGGSYLNLFSAHPPFQIDGNFASTAAVAKMFLHSELHLEDGEFVVDLELLPALPKAFGTGRISGLKAKGDLTVSITYDQGKLVDYECIKNNDLVKDIRVRT